MGWLNRRVEFKNQNTHTHIQLGLASVKKPSKEVQRRQVWEWGVLHSQDFSYSEVESEAVSLVFEFWYKGWWNSNFKIVLVWANFVCQASQDWLNFRYLDSNRITSKLLRLFWEKLERKSLWSTNTITERISVHFQTGASSCTHLTWMEVFFI